VFGWPREARIERPGYAIPSSGRSLSSFVPMPVVDMSLDANNDRISALIILNTDARNRNTVRRTFQGDLMPSAKKMARASRPDERQTAMLVAHLLATKQEEVPKEVTRARLAEVTLRRVFGRKRFSPDFLAEVQEWLLRSGWVLFFAGNTYAVVQTKVIEGWGRISSKRIGEDLRKVGMGEFDFDSLEHLLTGLESPGDEED
jgi:hypothetical protein